jgi:hypothetical protein
MATGAMGSFVPWAEIVRQIVGHVVRGGSAALRYTSTRRAAKSAWDQAQMTNLLGIIDMQLEKQRQELRRSAMMDTLAKIDEEWGTAPGIKAGANRQAIRSIITQIERADAERAANLLTTEAATASRRERQRESSRGVGGSVEEAGVRHRAAGTAVAAGQLATRRERSGAAAEQEISAKRGTARRMARQPIDSMRPDFTVSRGILQKMKIDEAAEQTPYAVWDRTFQQAGEGLGAGMEIGTSIYDEVQSEKLAKAEKERQDKLDEIARMLREGAA